jgi:hypothetical protein
MLTLEQKDTRITPAGDLITMADQDVDVPNSIITGDEASCFFYDPQPKRHSYEWKFKSSRKKFRLDNSKSKKKSKAIPVRGRGGL